MNHPTTWYARRESSTATERIHVARATEKARARKGIFPPDRCVACAFSSGFLNRVDEITIFDRTEDDLKRSSQFSLAGCRNVPSNKRSGSSCPILQRNWRAKATTRSTAHACCGARSNENSRSAEHRYARGQSLRRPDRLRRRQKRQVRILRKNSCQN